MHRIDGPGALAGGHFTEGDPVVGTPATVVTATWAEALQEEVAGVVEGAGMALAKPNNAQLLAAIKALVDAAVPVGSVTWGYFSAAPAGFLMMEGQLVARAAYPRLWAHAQAIAVVVADSAWTAGDFGMFSAGDGSTTFRLPRAGGQFARVLDRGAGVDDGRTLGSLQGDQNQAHAHGGVPLAGSDVDRGGGPSLFSVDEAGLTASSGGAESRPKSIAWAACVRF